MNHAMRQRNSMEGRLDSMDWTAFLTGVAQQRHVHIECVVPVGSIHRGEVHRRPAHYACLLVWHHARVVVERPLGATEGYICPNFLAP